MKQLGTATTMYMQDYDGAYPLAWYPTPQYGFDVVLFPYIKSYQVYECPSNKVTPRYWEGYPRMGIGADPRQLRDERRSSARAGGGDGRTGLTEAIGAKPGGHDPDDGDLGHARADRSQDVPHGAGSEGR